MIETQFNVFDSVIIAVMALSCLFAFYRGFVREILSLGAWVGAGIVTIYFFPAMAEKLQPHFKSAVVAAGFGTLGIYVTALIGFSMLNMIILKFMKSGSDVGMLDNAFGLLFGAFRGAFIVSLGFFLVTIALPEKEYPEWIKASFTHPYVEKGALVLARMAPEYLRQISPLNKKLEEEGAVAANKKGFWNQQDTNSNEEPGYSHETNQKLERLIEGTQPSR